MKFIDFSDKAIDCISIEQWRRLAKMERNGFENSSSKESAQNSEVILVCLSYDDGIRSERVSIAPHMAGKSKEVLHEDLINCHFAEILYFDEGFWLLNLKIEKCIFPTDLAKFKTKEDAIKAARLCKNAQTVVEAGEIIAKEFPEFATKILKHVDYYKNKHGVTV